MNTMSLEDYPIENIDFDKSANNNNKAIFFFRHYNDIDHITPIIYKFVSRTGTKTDIVILTDYKYTNDYRIEFLNKFKLINIHHISDLVDGNLSSTAQKINDEKLMPEIKSFGKKLPTKYPQKLWNVITSQTRSNFEKHRSSPKVILDELTQDSDNVVVAFDHISGVGDDEKGKFANAVVNEANSRGFHTLSLPHGDRTWYNLIRRHDEWNELLSDPNFAKPNKTPHDIKYSNNKSIEINYDYITTPNKYVSDWYRDIDGDRIKILGSPRFNEEWIQIMSTLLPQYRPSASKGKNKVVFFIRKPSHTISETELVRSIEIMASFEDIHLVVKSHTRSGFQIDKVFKKKAVRDELSEEINFVYGDVHSGSLLQWGDVFIDGGTSVVFEAIVRNKPIFTLEYLHSNQTTTGHLLDSVEINSREELYECLRNIKLDKNYTESDRDQFLKEMIYPNGKDVLSLYSDFISDMLISSESL